MEGHRVRAAKRRHLLTGSFSFIVATIVLLAASPARADVAGGADCTQRPDNPSCQITAGSSRSGGTSGAVVVRCELLNGETVPCYLPGKGWLVNGAEGPNVGCWFKPASADAAASADMLMGRRANPPAQWYEGTCGDPNTDFWPLGSSTLVLFKRPPLTTLLVQRAIENLNMPTPAIRLNPPPPAAQLVDLPTWLWLGTWGTRSATASIPGLSVTATAVPTTVVWSTGDGATVTCRDRGTAWTARRDPKAPSPTCGHTYSVSSASRPGGTFTVRATVTWHITWAGTTGISGDAGDLTTTATQSIRVREVAGLNTSGGAT